MYFKDAAANVKLDFSTINKICIRKLLVRTSLVLVYGLIKAKCISFYANSTLNIYFDQ